jgi:hypothetical protein
MLKRCAVVAATFFLALVVQSRAEDVVGRVREAVERSTLDQSGTQPFHLRAMLAPSFERDKGSGRTGEVEIWWESPTRWRREVRSSEFHQIEILDGRNDWQKNEGDYFPEWLREISIALIRPVAPPLDQLLARVKTAEVRKLMGQTNVNWEKSGSGGDVETQSRGQVALMDNSGLLFYAGGTGWDFQGHDYRDFHGRLVAQTVSVGSPEVTAKVVVLEDLGQVTAGFFDAAAPGGEPAQLRTLPLDEAELRKNLIAEPSVKWPPLQDGPLEGGVSAVMAVDREGKVRDVSLVVANNPGVVAAATSAFRSMEFRPYLVNGYPVQVVAQLSLPFKTARPAGVESFASARTLFENARGLGFPAAGNSSPYLMKAEFEARGDSGGVETGRYEDTWVSDSEWRREAWFGKSHYVRSRSGEKRYELAEGSEVGLLRVVFKVIEPIPAIDTFVESDWRIKRDSVDGTNLLRVASGYESPEGVPDSVRFRGYWIDGKGQLIKSYASGMETRRVEFADFGGKAVARRVDVLTGGKLVMRLRLTELAAAGTVDPKMFVVPKHEWVRQFTAEVR